MKCQTVFSGKNKKIFNMLSAEKFSHSAKCLIAILIDEKLLFKKRRKNGSDAKKKKRNIK